jgi:alpha-D-ribose 1-methylphosphonate 5-triphosphate diphosphatase
MTLAEADREQVTHAKDERVFCNARIVLPDGEIHGGLVIREGNIADIFSGSIHGARSVDLEGDYLIPGLIDLHTDNLEKHFTPRPGVNWPGVAAVLGHDAQVIAAGITTVFDALALGSSANREERKKLFPHMIAALEAATESGLPRADHKLHIRCEVTDPDISSLFENYAAHPLTAFISLMDHAPGQRQYPDLDAYRARMLKHGRMSRTEIDAHIALRVSQSQSFGGANRAALAHRAHGLALPVASHDDANEAHVAEAVSLGVTICEFPTTHEAARAARTAGMAILGGAPNVVRGGSHTGNVSTQALFEAGLLDMLSSDYVPASLLMAAFALANPMDCVALHRAIDLVSGAPARAAGLTDRGAIATGLRADLVQVRAQGDTPLVRRVWRAGRRVL